VDEGHSGLCDDLVTVQLRFGIVITPQNNFRIHRLHRVDLDLRRRARHNDDGPETELLRGQGDSLRMIAGACRDHAASALRLGEFRDLVVGAAKFEAEDGLLVLALQPHVALKAGGQAWREVERGLPRDFVDTTGQRLAQQLIQAGDNSGGGVGHIGIVRETRRNLPCSWRA
jgi:hypothetical protein